MPRRTVRLMIAGRVQGVGYRAWLQRTAVGLGLTGWVRNRASGEVEAIVSGPADAVDALIAACHRGPPAARVSTVAATDAPDEGTSGFETRATW